MTPTECVQLVAYVKQLVPAQRVEEYTPDAWHGVLADIPLDEAVAAAQRVVRAASWIDPNSIVREWRAIRDEKRRLTARAEPRALPSRYEDDTTRADRIRRGAALCRQVLAEHAPPEPEPERPLDESGRIRLAALDRARGGRRERRTDPAPLARLAGATLHQIRSTDR